MVSTSNASLRSQSISDIKTSGPIFLTGSTGQVGGALLQALAPFGQIIAPSRTYLDLAHPSAVRAFVRSTKPRWIVNPAAYTAVDKAESETAQAYAINAELPRVLGEEAAILGIPVLHFSTDYVFSGDGSKPWKEADLPAPHSIYGATKLEGERALTASGAVHLIFRTSWVYGATGNNFLLTILRAARERQELRIVADQHGAPTWSRDLARMVEYVISHAESIGTPANALTSLAGTYHACSAGETTWFGFAQKALELEQGYNPAQPFASLMPITTSEYPTPARRPANSRMDTTKLATAFGFTFPSWQDSLRMVLEELHPEAVEVYEYPNEK